MALFPEYEAPFSRLTRDWLLELARASDPVLQQIKFTPMPEMPDEATPAGIGHGGFYPADPAESVFELTYQQLLETDLDAWVAALAEEGQKLSETLVRHMFTVIGESCERTGNVLHADGRPLSYDLLIDLIERTELEVGEDFKFKGDPMFVLAPEMVQKVRELGPPTAEQLDRLDKVMRAKYERQNAQRRSRKLD